MPRLGALSNAMNVLLTIIRRYKMQDVHTKARKTRKDKREIEDSVKRMIKIELKIEKHNLHLRSI